MAAVQLAPDDVMPRTAQEVCLCVTNTIFPVGRYLCVPNASWGAELHWEADLLALSGSGYLYETEIKVSMADLKRDRDKQKWRLPDAFGPRGKMKALHFAMPASLAARPDAQALVLEWAGIISCRIRQRAGYAHYDARVIRKPKQNRKAPKHTDSYRLRYWSGERKRVTGGAA